MYDTFEWLGEFSPLPINSAVGENPKPTVRNSRGKVRHTMSYAKNLAKALGLTGLLHIDPNDNCFEPAGNIHEIRLYYLVNAMQKVPEASDMLCSLLPGKKLFLQQLRDEVEEASKFRSVGQEFCHGNIRFVVRTWHEDKINLGIKELLQEEVMITGCLSFLGPNGGTFDKITLLIARVK
jgi:hypothetical protein